MEIQRTGYLFLRASASQRLILTRVLSAVISGRCGCVLLFVASERSTELLMMEEAVTSPLARWENFYVIVGSSAGALTGLQFVVIALIAEAEAARSMAEIRAFGSPNVVHFCASLLISVIASAPWTSLTGPSWAFGIAGAAGIGYGINAIKHALRQQGYSPDFGDWMWFEILPLVGYVGLVCAALLLRSATTTALFIVGAMSLLLLFVGIHNAWDSVTYVAIKHFGAESKE